MYREIDKLDYLELHETVSSTKAVINGNTLDVIGYTFIVSSFDREGSYKIRQSLGVKPEWTGT